MRNKFLQLHQETVETLSHSSDTHCSVLHPGGGTGGRGGTDIWHWITGCLKQKQKNRNRSKKSFYICTWTQHAHQTFELFWFIEQSGQFFATIWHLSRKSCCCNDENESCFTHSGQLGRAKSWSETLLFYLFAPLKEKNKDSYSDETRIVSVGEVIKPCMGKTCEIQQKQFNNKKATKKQQTRHGPNHNKTSQNKVNKCVSEVSLSKRPSKHEQHCRLFLVKLPAINTHWCTKCVLIRHWK